MSVGGRIWNGRTVQPGVLHVDSKSGLIEKVSKSGKRREHIELGERLILPGAVDIHVHFRDPGQPHKEDLPSGSAAAAFGGVTGFVDMPNTVPPTTTVRALEEKLERMRTRSLVRWAAWAGGTWFTEDLARMLAHAAGVKVYLGATTGDLLLDDPQAFTRILQVCRDAKKPVVLHCEAQRVLVQSKRNEVSVVDHDGARPPLAEVEAIYDVMKALTSVRPGPSIHVCHVASKEAVRAAKSAGFSTGACPHHLVLDTARDWMHAYGKVNPPLRAPAQREALWTHFAAGDVPILESDHAPHSRGEKEETFARAPAGIPGVETMVPLMLARVASGVLEMERLVDAMATRPSALLGLPPPVLQAGGRADFFAVDMGDVSPVDADALHSKAGWSPFDGMDAVFPTHTFVAGHPVVADRELVAEPGSAPGLI